MQIVSRQHLISALYNTILTTLPDPMSTESSPKTRTHNLHSEVLLGLSLGTNITDSIRRHGIANDSKRVLLVRIGGLDSAEAVWGGMKGLVDGTSVGLEELDDGTGVDWSRVDKVNWTVSCVQKLMVGVQGS
jgi:EKC/KEOPS complex subunit CGI121/TPRKB